MSKELILKEVTVLEFNYDINKEVENRTSYHEWIMTAIRAKENKGLKIPAMAKLNALKKIIRVSAPGETIKLDDQEINTLKEIVKDLEGAWVNADDEIIQFHNYIQSL